MRIQNKTVEGIFHCLIQEKYTNQYYATMEENVQVNEQLHRLNELRKQGVISDKEYKDQKQRLLAIK